MRKRHRVSGERVEEREPFIFSADAPCERFDEDPFGRRFKFGIGPVKIEEVENAAVDQGPTGLHEVVDEAEGVVAVMMVEPERGVQCGGAHGPGDGGAKYAVAVGEELVGPLAVAVTPEIGTQ